MFATASSDGAYSVVDIDTGRVKPLTRDAFDELLRAQAPKIEETPEQLHDECLALVTSLFQTSNVHPLKLDGNPIEPVEGGSPGMEYFHYINGHTLQTNGTRRTYTSYTYITCVEMEEQMVIDDGKIVVILINTFDFAGIRTSGPNHESWTQDLYHMRELLTGAVARWVEDEGHSRDV